MSGESNLKTLLANMKPSLQDDAYVFLTAAAGFTEEELKEGMMIFKETEGVTLVIKEALAASHGREYMNKWALITLTVHSDLNAVGFLAAITAELAKIGVSVNAVSAYYHDHLFVPWEKKEAAMDALKIFRTA